MRIQYNKQTLMTWVYIPMKIVRFLGLQKGDEVEFTTNEKENKAEIKKMVK